MAIGKQFYRVEVQDSLKRCDWCGNYYVPSAREAKFHQENCLPKLRKLTVEPSGVKKGGPSLTGKF